MEHHHPDDEAADPSIVILNPFWARTPEDQSEAGLLPAGRLTVRSPPPSPIPPPESCDDRDDDEVANWPPDLSEEPAVTMRKLASLGSSGSSATAGRRPLVKQKKYYHHSAEDLTVTVHGPAGSVSPDGDPSWSPAGRDELASPHHLRPVAVIGGGSSPNRSPTPSGRVAGLRQQPSVESRVSINAPPSPVTHKVPPSSQQQQPRVHHQLPACHSTSNNKSGVNKSAGVIGPGPIEDGAELPPAFEPVPTHLYGKPLQEIDPTVRDKVPFARTARVHL